MNDIHDAIVIGAGPAGLATSRELARRGVSHLVLERGSQVGQTWADLYDGLVLHTARALSTLPGLDFPPGTPQFPTRACVLAYLRQYAREFDLPVRTGADVVDVHPASPVWHVATGGGERLTARTVVVATGIVSSPHLPELAGRERFEGRVMHSVEYRRPEPFAGDRVLVIGAGNSAGDIACELARVGADVTIAIRGGVTVLPLRIAGLPSQYFGVALGHLPRPVQRAVSSALGAVSRAAGQSVLPPASPGRRCPSVPIIGAHLSDAVRTGAVRLKGGVAELGPRAARFHDGTTLAVDSVILATGYRAAVSFLGGRVRVDACGFAERSGPVASADQSGLFFVGHSYDIRGAFFNIARDARRAASRIRSTLDDRRRRSTETGRRPNER